MKLAISKNTGKEWYKSMIDLTDNNVSSFISDYENYAQFVVSQNTESFILSYWYNESRFRTQLNENDELNNTFEKNCKSISYHHYN